MMKFIDNIVCYLITDISLTKEIKQEVLSASLNKTDADFALKLYKDSNAIASKTQIHSSSHNTTCFKYGVAATGKCWFDFPCHSID